MIERYSRPEMAALWTDEHKFATWLKVELAACEAMAAAGLIPRRDWAVIRRKASFDVARIRRIEAEVRHDVIAFLTAVAERVGPAARHIHKGLTSSDVVDTALAVNLVAAADLLSQAEHDELASSILLTPDEELAGRVSDEVRAQLKRLSRGAIAAKAIRDYGLIVITQDLVEAVEVANRFAPEHLELLVKNPRGLLPGIRNAGAVFLGHCTPEALGDYLAGPNHILPTGGTARFSSPLGVYDFVKRISVLNFDGRALATYGKPAAEFAAMEGLDAHGKSILARLRPKKS